MTAGTWRRPGRRLRGGVRRRRAARAAGLVGRSARACCACCRSSSDMTGPPRPVACRDRGPLVRADPRRSGGDTPRSVARGAPYDVVHGVAGDRPGFVQDPPHRPVRRESRSRPLLYSALRRGAIAQLGERLNGIQKVRGSNPLSSTNDLDCTPTPLTPSRDGGVALTPCQAAADRDRRPANPTSRPRRDPGPRAATGSSGTTPPRSSRAGRRAGTSSACTGPTSTTRRGRRTTC